MTDQTASDTDDTTEASETTEADEAKADDTDEAKADSPSEAEADGPTKAKLDELGDKIHRVRSKAEESVEGVGGDQASGPIATGASTHDGDEERPTEFHESGETESSDDQTVAPPG